MFRRIRPDALKIRLSYCIALTYQYAYASVFNYSQDFISIDIKSMFISAVLSLITYVGIAVTVEKIFRFLERKGVWGEIIKRALIFPIIFTVCLVLIVPKEERYNYFLIILLIFLIHILKDIMASSKEEKHLTIEERAKKNIQKEEDELKAKSFKFCQHEYLHSLIEYLLLFCVCILFSAMVGNFAAKQRTNFYFFEKDNKKYAIINIYNDNVITTEIINNRLSSDTTYFKTENLSGLTIHKTVINREK